MKKQVLIVDDEPDLRSLLSITMSRMNLKCFEAENIERAKKLLLSQKFDLCLTDMRLPDGDGLDLVDHIQQHYADLPVAVITAYGNVETAVRALKFGAFDFIAKPVKLETLRTIAEAALNIPKLGAQPSVVPMAEKLLGNSASMQSLREMISKVARSQSPVYIQGSTGTGKELVARLIHELSGRKEAPWVPVNCGAIPSELMESEFFGHKKGSFTGAHQDTAGLFEVASGGTLFLDEIAELPMSMQVKLLRSIQERKIKPVGSTKEFPVDVRILCATHTNLLERVRAGKFRNDLFYRLNVIELNVPDLNNRREDIPLLTDKILTQLNNNSNQEEKSLAPGSLEILYRHNYLGNIRELENILERAFTLCDRNIIKPEDIILQDSFPLADQAKNYEPGSVPLDDHLAEIERVALIEAIEKSNGNKTAAATLLGMSFRSMRYKLKKYKL